MGDKGPRDEGIMNRKVLFIIRNNLKYDNNNCIIRNIIIKKVLLRCLKGIYLLFIYYSSIIYFGMILGDMGPREEAATRTERVIIY